MNPVVDETSADAARWRAFARHWPGCVLTVDRDDRIVSLSRSTPHIDAQRDLGRDLFDFVAPDQREALGADLAASRAGATVVSRRVCAHLSDDASRVFESRFVALDDGGVMILSTAAAPDHTEERLHAALERSRRDVEARERMAARLATLAEASREFTEATSDYDRLLAAVARRLGTSLGDLCCVGVVREDGAAFEPGVAYHDDAEVSAWAQRLLEGPAQRVGEGAVGRVAATGQAVFLPVISTAEYVASTLPRFGPILERLRVGSAMIVPMMCRGRVIGVASLLRSGTERPYTVDDLHLMRSVADHAGLAITNARSHAAERAARAAAVDLHEERRESELAHRLLFEASPLPLLVFDVETLAILAVNDAAVRQYGYAHDALLRMTLPSLRPVGDRESVRATVDALGDTLASGIVRHQRSDGSLFLVEYTSRTLLFGGHRARLAVLSDVTSRREADEMRALLAAIVSSSNDAIVSKRLDGVITSWNAAAERLFGYTAAEAIGQLGSLTIPNERLDEEGELIRRVEAGLAVERFETLRRRKDGSDIEVSISLAPILDASGAVVGVSKTARDLSAQRRAEATLKRTEAQLRQAQKMEAIGRLAGGVAHDFNNILSVILSYTELLLGDLGPDASTRGDLEEVQKAARRAADLTRQLLMFSRQQVVAPRVLDLNDTLAAMDKMVLRILGEDIELVTAPAAELGRVMADPGNIEQIIMNLVVNARDAMPSGGTLTLETADVELDATFEVAHPGVTPIGVKRESLGGIRGRRRGRRDATVGGSIEALGRSAGRGERSHTG